MRIHTPCINLDHAIFPRLGIEGILDITLPNDTEMPNHLDRSAPQHVVLVVIESLTGGDDDRVACMGSQGIKIFHVAADDGVVGTITNDFVLEFFPAFHTTLDEDLRREGKRFGGEISELDRVIGETRTQATQSESRTKDDRVTDRFCSLESRIDAGDGGRLSNWDVDF